MEHDLCSRCGGGGLRALIVILKYQASKLFLFLFYLLLMDILVEKIRKPTIKKPWPNGVDPQSTAFSGAVVFNGVEWRSLA